MDEIRRKKMEGVMQFQQERINQRAQEQTQIQQQIEQMESVVKQFLTKDALSRYGNLKTAHQEKSLQLLLMLFQAIQKGQIHAQIDDSTLKKVLEQLTPRRREISIKRA